MHKHRWTAALTLALAAAAVVVALRADDERKPKQDAPPHDAIADAQTPRQVPAERPEQKKSPHDLSDIFEASKAPNVSPALNDQPEKGRFEGFDFGRDPPRRQAPHADL